MPAQRKHKAGTTPAQRVSASLAIDSLSEVCADVRNLEQQLTDLRGERDSLIRETLQWVPMLRLVPVTGLSRERLYKISTSAPKDEQSDSTTTPDQ